LLMPPPEFLPERLLVVVICLGSRFARTGSFPSDTHRCAADRSVQGRWKLRNRPPRALRPRLKESHTAKRIKLFLVLARKGGGAAMDDQACKSTQAVPFFLVGMRLVSIAAVRGGCGHGLDVSINGGAA
jgi:hypothetical protein